MSVSKANRENFEELVLKSDKPVLLDFYADWCGPCRMVGPVVAEIAEEHPELAVVKVNVDDDPELAEAFGVNSIPALFAVKSGKVVGQSVGFRPKEQLLALFS